MLTLCSYKFRCSFVTDSSINVVSTSTNVVFDDTAREYDEIQPYYEPSTDKPPDTQVTDDRDPTQQQQGEQHDTVSTTRVCYSCHAQSVNSL